MTKEEEAIEWLNRFKTIKVLYGNTFAMTLGQLKTLQEAIETVLNMIKKKDKSIEIQKDNYKNLTEDISKIAKELGLEEDGTIDEIFAEIEKKDKIIDLLIDFIYKIAQKQPGTAIHYLEKNGFNTSKCNNCITDNDCRKCFKQYFERKARRDD